MLAAEPDHDFKVRIFDNNGGERTSGTITVKIEQLKKNGTSVGQTFNHHTKSGKVSTGIEIEWKEEDSGIHTFEATIQQSDGTVSQEGIRMEFQYSGTAQEIYSNKFHTIKIIPNSKGHNKSE